MKFAIVGTVGVPAKYGGFETLAENLVHFHQAQETAIELSVYCSSKNQTDRPAKLGAAHLKYSRFKANGLASIFYDAVTLFDAVRQKNDVVFLFGVSGAIALPFVKAFSKTRVVTNVDGIEWKRRKWGRIARIFLKFSERLAVRYSDEVIADNPGILRYLKEIYSVDPKLISYGGDHAVSDIATMANSPAIMDLPDRYALSICRIEPENNVDMIIRAFAGLREPLVVIGNWSNSTYGRELRARYGHCPNILLANPIYDPALLYPIRAGAKFYVHGHAAGGTNPSLVEMMHFGLPIVAFDCEFNRHTTKNDAFYFSDADHLVNLVPKLEGYAAEGAGRRMKTIAEAEYTWDKICRAYFDLARKVSGTSQTQ